MHHFSQALGVTAGCVHRLVDGMRHAGRKHAERKHSEGKEREVTIAIHGLLVWGQQRMRSRMERFILGLQKTNSRNFPKSEIERIMRLAKWVASCSNTRDPNRKKWRGRVQVQQSCCFELALEKLWLDVTRKAVRSCSAPRLARPTKERPKYLPTWSILIIMHQYELGLRCDAVTQNCWFRLDTTFYWIDSWWRKRCTVIQLPTKRKK
jgi:hypothetical protein